MPGAGFSYSQPIEMNTNDLLEGIQSDVALHVYGDDLTVLQRMGERIVHTDAFDDPNLSGEMKTTVSLKKVFCGTEVSVVQEGIPAVIPAEACYLGWQESLVLLAQLVEAEIPG